MLRLFYILGYAFSEIINAHYSEFVVIDFLYLCSVIYAFFIFNILFYSQSDGEYAAHLKILL